MKKLSILLSIFLVSFLLTAADWPQFHGPNRDNMSKEAGLLKTWPADGPKLLWKCPGMGIGYATVSVAKGFIYTSGCVGRETDVFCIDDNGKIVWTTPNGNAWTAQNPGTRGTPTIDDKLVYHLNPGGSLMCLNATDGKEIWKFNLGKYKGKAGSWGFAESILVQGPNILAMTGGPNSLIMSFDKMTGKEVLAGPSNKETASYNSPVIAKVAGTEMILTMSQKSAVGIDPKTLQILWSYKHETPYDVNAACVLAMDDLVYFSSGYGTGGECVKITKSGDSFTAEKVWSSKDQDNHHGGVILYKGYLYGSGDRQKGFTCIDMKTGKTIYKDASVGKGSLTYADGMFYQLSEGGELSLIEATPEKCNVVSKFNIPKENGDFYWAHPVISNSRLYIRHADILYCYDIKGK